MTTSTRAPRVLGALAGAAVALALPAGASAATAGKGLWRAAPAPAKTVLARGLTASLARPGTVRTLRLDRAGMARALAQAPRELSSAASSAPLVLTLPLPDGGFQRFSVASSPVMAAGLQARHPEIQTYAGTGIDDPTANIRADLSPLGFHASIRSTHGIWYVEPASTHDQATYVSYYGRDLKNAHGTFVEREAAGLMGDMAGVDAEAPAPSVGDQLRTYRLALISDPSYATYFGPENVTAAKVVLLNRLDQIYESELSIRMILIDDTDRLNLNTPELAWGPNGPCGAAPCYDEPDLEFCSFGLLVKSPTVAGQIVGADAYDIGHVALGKNGGGIAGLGVVGSATKAVGCTGLPQPDGDFYAVDYVAHEMGHQFGANHSFNGNDWNCSPPNRNGPTSVEPGSGSSIMAYAGICRQDNLQPHSDPYFSQRSFREIYRYTNLDQPDLNERQNVSLLGFDTDGDSFTLSWNGVASAPIVRGLNYTPEGIAAAIQAIPGFPAGATVAVGPFGVITAYGPFGDIGFSVTFGGTLAGIDVPALSLTDPNGMSGFVGTGVQGGPVGNHGSTVTPTGNHAPVVDAGRRSYWIPYRTPFALTGSATDADGDTVTFMWEQNDHGTHGGTALVDNHKVDGPLFRQFGTRLDATIYDPHASPSPGENVVTTDPTRVFPDLAQILTGNTNAETGTCAAPPPWPQPVPLDVVDCYSEFLPTKIYDGPLHFRLTARDGRGGVSSADAKLYLAPSSGPFLVTSPNGGESLAPGSTQTVTWKVAGTRQAPIDAKTVDVLLSTDGGVTWTALASAVPNTGSAQVVLPAASSTTARIEVKPTDNVFFDVSDADFSIAASGAATLPDGSRDLRALTTFALPAD
jgi:hypothetical protein